MAIPTTPLGSGSVIIATTTPAGATNYTQLLYSQSDAQRLFQAWQAQTKNPTGTVAQFTTWLGQYLNNQLLAWVIQNETTTPVTPTITISNA